MKQFYTILLALLVTTATFGQTSKSESIDKFLNLLNENQKFMGVVGIYENGEEKYSKASGYLSLDAEQALNTNAKFRIGSISKMFTAVLVFQAIENGDLSLDSPLSQFYPEITNAKRINISDMLRHKSGIPNFTNTAKYVENMNTGLTEQEVLDIIKSMPVELEPRTETSYSNSNYYLLSRILEKATKKSYKQLLNQGIVEPLKLESTYYGGTINTAELEAYSYTYDNDSQGWSKSEETDMRIPLGAGAIVSNTRDLSQFINALFAGKLVSESSLNQMKEISQGLGRGMMIFPFYERAAYGHNGSIDGFESSLAYFPEEKVAVVILANALADYNFNNVALGVLSYWFDKPFELPDFSEKPIQLTTEQLKVYDGTYFNAQLSMNIKVWAENNVLLAQAEGQSAFNLNSYDNATFKFAPAGIVMKFDTDKKQFTLLQGGGEFVFVMK